MRRARLLALAVLASAGVLYGQGTDKTLFLSVVDSAGKPVTDMTAEDFAVREDGVEREVVALAPAKAPLRVALLVDTTAGTDRYLQDIRAGFIAFIRDVLASNPQSEIALWEFGVASQRLRDFTNDDAVLERDMKRLTPRSAAGSVLLESIYDASEALAKRSGQRRAIVVFNVEPNVEMTERQPKQINESLMKSRAQLWTLSLQRGQIPSGGRDALLTTLARNAGGRREMIIAESAIERYMRQYAAALAAQYELTYRRPSGAAQVVVTGIRRDGVKLIAGLFAPR